MTHDPAHVGGRPPDLAWAHAVDVVHGPLVDHSVPPGGVLDTLGLASGATGVEDGGEVVATAADHAGGGGQGRCGLGQAAAAVGAEVPNAPRDVRPLANALRGRDGRLERVIGVQRVEGITSSVVVPGGGFIGGQAAWVDLVAVASHLTLTIASSLSFYIYFALYGAKHKVSKIRSQS